MDTETISVPIFPLPDVVLFPGMLLPLHIFEPRYKEMISDSLQVDGMIGIVQLKPGWEKDYYGEPAVYKVLGIGRIIKHRRLEDGRYDILVEGHRRGQIVKELKRGDYRMADVELLQDYVPVECADDVDRAHKRLLKLVQVLLSAVPAKVRTFKTETWENMTSGTVADVLASMVIEDAYEKQSILSEVDVARRLKLVQVQLRTVLKPGQ